MLKKIRQKYVDIHTEFLHKFLHIPIIVILPLMRGILMKRLSYDRKARRHCYDYIVDCVAGWWAVGRSKHAYCSSDMHRTKTPTEFLIYLVKLKGSFVRQRKISVLSALSCH
jgi:hypothetical protein